MSFAMLIILIVFFGVVSGAGLVGFMLGRSRLPPSFPAQDRRLAEQVERLEDELQRVKDQADFTERLLTEGGGAPSERAPGEDPKD